MIGIGAISNFMIIVRAPLRISFVGGGTDLPDFYQKYPGRVISTAIDKYVYVSINPAPIFRKVMARYSQFESVEHASQLKNDRLRAALLDLGIERNIDVSTFSDMAMGAGLGSSSSFSVALMKGLHALQGRKLDKREVAELACRLEINLLKQPIGKQDQYASALGGFNVLQFNPDHSVAVEPVSLDYRKKLSFASHLLLFFTGIERSASEVLNEQKANIDKKLEVLKSMAGAVAEFKNKLVSGDFEGLGRLLHDGWLKKKSLAAVISNAVIDDLYEVGLRQGAWGGKLLGAGAGGCLLFLAPPDKQEAIRSELAEMARRKNLKDFMEIPVKFAQSGAEILINDNFTNHGVGHNPAHFL